MQRIARLVCSACGTEQRAKLAIVEGAEVSPPCASCGADALMAWPKLSPPAPERFAVVLVGQPQGVNAEEVMDWVRQALLGEDEA